MRTRSQKGGVITVLLGLVLVGVISVVVISVLVVNSVKVRHREGRSGDSVRIETPLGDMNIDARDTLNPDTIGVPIYPGATRKSNDHGGVSFDFDNSFVGSGGGHKKLSIAGASYTTEDSAEKVREFYHSHLPNWTISQRHGHNLEIHYSEGGYKRIIAIEEKNGGTHIGIASIGEPGVN